MRGHLGDRTLCQTDPKDIMKFIHFFQMPSPPTQLLGTSLRMFYFHFQANKYKEYPENHREGGGSVKQRRKSSFTHSGHEGHTTLAPQLDTRNTNNH